MFKDSGNDAHDSKDGTHYNPDNQTPFQRMMIKSDSDDDDNRDGTQYNSENTTPLVRLQGT